MTRRHITAEVAAGHIWGQRARAQIAAICAVQAASDTRGDVSGSVSAPPEREPEDPDHIERRETAMRVRQEAMFS